MARRTIVLCLILGLLAAANAVPFDFYYLILMWPGSYCTTGNCCMPKYGYPAEDFYIESFQTFDLSTTKPAVRCGNDSPFDINKLDKIENSMKQYWSDIECPSTDGTNAWKSAWDSYGVCSGMKQQDYFEAGLDLRERANVLGALAEQGIKPDFKLYSPEEIRRAVRKKLGVAPALTCGVGPGSWKNLYQVILCVGADAETFIECPRLPATATSCPESVVFQTFRTWMLNSTAVAAADNDKKILLPTETALN